MVQMTIARGQRNRRPPPLMLVAGLVGLLVATAGAWQPTPHTNPQAAGLSPARLREATDLLQGDVSAQRIAGAVAAVARHGTLGYLEAVGVQDLQTRTPMTERTLFRIYSMTKPITAVAVMMLHEEKRFSLDDPVSRFIPEFKNLLVADPQGGAPHAATRTMTVRDLLLHTSGLDHRTSEIYRREQVRSRTIPMSQFIANLVRVPLMEEPGTRYRYSEATTVLGRLVEIWSRQPFHAFLEQRIFQPLRMRDTTFWTRTADERARLATVYGPAPGGGLVEVQTETLPFTERPTLIEGAVGLLSTVPDYLRFCQMLLNKGELDGVRLLRADTVETMTSNGLSPDVLKARSGSMGWGLANVDVVVNPAANNPANRGEYGWDGTAGTIFWIDPATETITILMTQSSPANPERIRQRFKAVVQQAVVQAVTQQTSGPQAVVNPASQAARPAPASGVASRLVGAWQLATRTVSRADGTILADPVLGQQPPGRLYYDASGAMMLQMMRTGRTGAISTPASPQDAANPRVVLGYDAYFGKYTVDERAGTITHRVEGSLFPEDLGKDFVRLFTLEGDTLTLKFTSPAEGGDITRRLVFRRLR